MLAESENVNNPIRVTDGSVSFPSTYKELISKPRNVVISRMVSSPILPDVSTAITMSEPREQSTDNSYDVAEVAACAKLPMTMMNYRYRQHHHHHHHRFFYVYGASHSYKTEAVSKCFNMDL